MIRGDDRFASVMPVFGFVVVVSAVLMGLLIGSAVLGVLVGLVFGIVAALVVIRYAVER